MPHTKYLSRHHGPIAPSDVLGTYSIASLSGVAPQTVANWIDRGLLRGWRVPGSRSERRVLAGDLRAFLERHGMPVPERLQ